MKWFPSASAISWFYLIEYIITVLLSDTPRCFSPQLLYVISIRFIAAIGISELKKKVESYSYYIICFVSFSRIYIISNISSDQANVFTTISIVIYIILGINVVLLSFVLCIKFEDDSRVINRNIIVFFATFWQIKIHMQTLVSTWLCLATCFVHLLQRCI